MVQHPRMGEGFASQEGQVRKLRRASRFLSCQRARERVRRVQLAEGEELDRNHSPSCPRSHKFKSRQATRIKQRLRVSPLLGKHHTEPRSGASRRIVQYLVEALSARHGEAESAHRSRNERGDWS